MNPLFVQDATYTYSFIGQFNQSYLLVLVGGDSNELCLLEHVRAEGGVGQLQDVVGAHQVEARLVFVHRVQNRLQIIIR